MSRRIIRSLGCFILWMFCPSHPWNASLFIRHLSPGAKDRHEAGIIRKTCILIHASAGVPSGPATICCGSLPDGREYCATPPLVSIRPIAALPAVMEVSTNHIAESGPSAIPCGLPLAPGNVGNSVDLPLHYEWKSQQKKRSQRSARSIGSF